MEHSYTRDWQPNENIEVMATRTILIDRPPQCPSCHLTPNDDKLDAPESYNPPIPAYNEEAGRAAMDETERSVRTSMNKNNRSDEEDWEARISKLGWTEQHHNLFRRVERLLDLHHMARLAFKDSSNECLRRRTLIEKSVSRMRHALASVQWNTRLTQWLHGLLSNNLSPSYNVSYIEILQALKRKQPALVEKMMHERAIDLVNNNTKRPWEPTVVPKDRKLPGEAVLVIVPSTPTTSTDVLTNRMQRWHQLLGTLATVAPIQAHINVAALEKQSFEQITEQLVAMSRAKIAELRSEVPNRQIVLVGFNAGAALAVQVALVETVSSVVCLGFSYNTINGVRGAPDDRILQITTPILFVMGQVAQRSSQEEIESLREKMQAQTSLVVVGSADDSLRVNKMNRKLGGVTQSMIDNMITDEIQDFASTCINNPPGPRQPKLNNVATDGLVGRAVLLNSNSNVPPFSKKSKHNDPSDSGRSKNVKVGRPRINRANQPVKKPRNPKRLLNQSNEALQMAIDNIPNNQPAPAINDGIPPLRPIIGGNADAANEVISTFEVVASSSGQTTLQSLKPVTNKIIVPAANPQLAPPPPTMTQKVKFVQGNQFIKLQPPPLNTQKIYMKTPKSVVSPQQSITFRVASSGDGKTPVGNKLITVKGKGVGTQILTTTNMVQQQQQQQQQRAGPPIATGTFATATATASPVTVRPSTPKFTIIKQSGQQIQPSPIQIQGHIQLQGQVAKLPSTVAQPSTNTAVNTSASNSDLLSTSILDIPILFADNEGNINDHPQSIGDTKDTVVFSTPTATSAGNYIVIASQPNISKTTMIQSRPVVVSSYAPTNALAGKVTMAQQNKFVVINRNNLKQATTNPAANRSTTPIKYAKMVVPATDGATVTSTTVATKTMVANANATLTPGTKIDISSLMKSGAMTTKNPVTAAASVVGAKPIIINIDSDKSTFKNVIKIPSSEVQQLKTASAPANSIVLKQGEFRAMGTVGMTGMPVIKGGILNRNITVRKINIIRQPALSAAGTIVTATPATSTANATRATNPDGAPNA